MYKLLQMTHYYYILLLIFNMRYCVSLYMIIGVLSSCEEICGLD